MNEETLTKNFVGNVIEKKEKLVSYVVKIMPAWLTPNIISIMRALFIIPIYFVYRQELYAWTIALFIIALFTDLLDGVQARYLKKESDLGKLLDPAADKILFIGLFLLIAPDRLSPAIIYTIIILESLLVLMAIVIGPIFARFLNIKRKLGSNIAGKIKMNLEGLAVIVLLFGLNSHTVIFISELILWLAALLALLSILLHLFLKEKNTKPVNNYMAE